jgi:hypothetical protein
MIKDLFKFYCELSDSLHIDSPKGVRSMKIKKIRFIFIYFPLILPVFFILLILASDLKNRSIERKNKQDFNAKYKTVVKVNSLGFKSYEYHER